jgi:hypothetical protein
MANRRKAPGNLNALPMLLRESIYIGVDIGKFKHVAGFISKTLLERHQHARALPFLRF